MNEIKTYMYPYKNKQNNPTFINILVLDKTFYNGFVVLDSKAGNLHFEKFPLNHIFSSFN